jgi:6-phosphofructokinase 1
MAPAFSPEQLGILVGGGPAPGINGVISAVTIEALEDWPRPLNVIGFLDGFKHMIKGDAGQGDPSKFDTMKWRNLTIEFVKSINLRGGSVLRTSRTNPAKSEDSMNNVLKVLRELNITNLVTIGGDDTAYSASQVYARAGGKIKVAHVPKTIDNDLPLPEGTPTFGFETARHVGVGLVRNLAEDARTTSRWYIVVSMGRSAGHLALGIGKAAAATLTIIPEEFRDRAVTLDEVCDIIISSIILRKCAGNNYGIAVLAEGLLSAIGEEGLKGLIKSGELSRYGKVEYDPFGHLRLGLIDFARLIKDQVATRVKALDIQADFVDKEVGYELRCADPVPFDAEYTRDLGYAAVKFLLSEDSAKFGAIVSVVGGKMRPLPFDEMLDPVTKRMQTRLVDVNGEGYRGARSYMIRLDRRDFDDPAQLARLAETAKMTPDAFRARFGYLVR